MHENKDGTRPGARVQVEFAVVTVACHGRRIRSDVISRRTIKPRSATAPTPTKLPTMAFTTSDICKVHIPLNRPLTPLTVFQIILAIFLPPLGVFLERGCGADFVRPLSSHSLPR